MIARLAALHERVFAALGRMSMYRLTLAALGVLTLIALAVSPFGLVVPTPLEIVATLVVLVGVGMAADAVARRLVGRAWRAESTLLTSAILLFVLRPTSEPEGLLGIALAAATASCSTYVLAWRRRHVFNPAAVGAAVLTLVSAVSGAYELGGSAWWVGSPVLGPAVVVLGVAVLWRAAALRMAALYAVIALVVGVVRTVVQYAEAGIDLDLATVLSTWLWSSPLLFLGAFMLSEPLTRPPRRGQQLLVAAVVGVLVGWPIDLGVITLGAERALLVGNLVAFLLAARTGVRLTLQGRRAITPTVTELSFRATGRMRFAAGQYLELEVPHRRPDARGTRREFSILSAPEELPTVRIAFRDGREPRSSFKRALAEVPVDGTVEVTGVWGDAVLPRSARTPLLLVAAGIGITPFVSQLHGVAARGESRDIVLVLVASSAAELAYRADLERAGIRVVVFCRDEPEHLADRWRWAGGARLDAAAIRRVVPDLADRRAYVSGPAGLVADLAPALAEARGLVTDGFSGY